VLEERKRRRRSTNQFLDLVRYELSEGNESRSREAPSLCFKLLSETFATPKLLGEWRVPRGHQFSRRPHDASVGGRSWPKLHRAQRQVAWSCARFAKVAVKRAIVKAVLAGLAPSYSWDSSRHDCRGPCNTFLTGQNWPLSSPLCTSKKWRR
jgi:hypothetical protein